jgi:hypothetical protein
MADTAKLDRAEIRRGFFYGIAVNVAVIVGCLLLSALSKGELFWLVMFLPGMQWIVMLPAMAILRDKQRYGLVQGMFYAAMVSLLVTLIFWFWIISNIDI